MRSSLLGLITSLALASSAAAQTVPKPGMLAAPVADAVQIEPLVVEASVPSGAAITGNNTSGVESGAGVTGLGLIGVTGRALLNGGIFTASYGTGLIGNGRYFGVSATCQAGSGEGCAAVHGETLSGTGLHGVGVVGVFGRALPNYDVISRQESLAGSFIGPVRITDTLHVEGSIDAPVIAQLTSQIASLTARLAILEASIGPSATLIPARIQAEDYDRGGQDVGYVDSSPGNTGGAYRTDDVDIKNASEGGYVVGWMTAGEWVAYTVNVPESGSYAVTARVGSALPGRTFHLEVNGVDVTGPVAVPSFPEWDQYANVSLGNVMLPAGRQMLRFVVGDQDYLDFTWFEVTR